MWAPALRACSRHDSTRGQKVLGDNLLSQNKDKKGKVVDVIEKGYYLNDLIIRHAKVVVGE